MAFNSLGSNERKELRDVIDQMTAVSVDSFEKVEMAVAYGCPRGQFMSVVNMKTENDQLSLTDLLSKLKDKVEEKLGKGAFDEEEITMLVDGLVLNNRDLFHYRNLIKSYNVSAFVVNKIVEFRTRSPLDSGQALLTELFQIEDVKPPETEYVDEECRASSVESSDRRFSIERAKAHVNPELRKMIVDVVLGIGLGVTAIALLV